MTRAGEIASPILPEFRRDPATAERVTLAFMEMGRIDIATLAHARAG